MIRTQLGGEVFVAREGEPLQSIGRVVGVEWNLNRPAVVDVEQTRPLLGYDPAEPQQPYLSAMVRSRAYGVPRRRYRPGKLSETRVNFLTLQSRKRYPKRIDLARERRRLAELNRRDRRRRRTGRPRIGLQGPVEVQTRYPRVQIAPPLIEGHLQLIVDQMAGLTVRMNVAVAEAARAFTATALAFADSHAFRRSLLDDLMHYRRRVMLGAGEQPHPAADWLDVDAVWREVTESDQRAEHHRSRLAEHVERAGPFASGGMISPPRAPDDDTIPVRISPGEAWVTPDMARRWAPALLQMLNGPGTTLVHLFGRDVTHRDRFLGDGGLDRDETSGRHSLDSSGKGAVWSDLMARIDDLVDEKE
jgi:hypothetical protein